MNDLVTVKTAANPTAFGVMQTYLESEGIACYVIDGNISRSYGLLTGGAKLQVAADDAERAVELLIEGGFADPKEYRDADLPGMGWLRRLIEKWTSNGGK